MKIFKGILRNCTSFSFFVYLILFSFIGAHAQQSEEEKKLWAKYYSEKDSAYSVLTLIKISETCFKRDRNLSEKIANKSIYEAKKFGNKKYLAKAISRMSNVYFENGKYEESYYLADELLKLSSEINDDFIYADACKNIGRRHHFRGDYPKALEYYLKSLRYFEKSNSIIPMGEVYNSIGGVYLNQVDNENAYKYYRKSQVIQFKNNNINGIARGYINIANVLIAERDHVNARKILDSALYYYEKIDSDEGRALVYANLSDVYVTNLHYDSALISLMKAHDIFKKNSKYYTLTQIDAAISDLFNRKNDTKNALIYLNEGIEIANSTNQSHNLVPLLLLKSQILEKMGKTAEAFENYKLYKSFSDTVINAGAIRKQTEASLKYDYNKKEYQQQIEKQALLAEQKEKETRQKFILNFTLIGLSLVLLILFLVIRSYRNNQKNSKIIANQKAEVEKQHHLLQEKNKEVLDSINYAKRLQQAILPSMEIIKRSLPQSFVLYKPKDIVAGDFYWMESIQQSYQGKVTTNILIAAADCTGHGVPGSLVSVVCSNALNRAVYEFGMTDPGKILDKTRELVIATFEKSDKEVKDGMDISLCSIDPENRILYWAGANNPLWIINAENGLKEYKADKQPIGKYTSPTPFKTQEIKLNKGDRIFIFTDGFADQFGGPDSHRGGKKFKYKQLQEALVHSISLPLNQQEDLLEKSFNNWKGELEQVDDVCVIGIEI